MHKTSKDSLWSNKAAGEKLNKTLLSLPVPVKNQGRWVGQLISEMEQLFEITGDKNFNVIIVDYSSTDVDVKKTLQSSTLPRYELATALSYSRLSPSHKLKVCSKCE